jgi:hypothetical protein
MSTTEKDELIGAAYERLDGALAPPLDGAQRVARRVEVRRRRRRVVRTGIATITVVGVVGAAALARSGDSPEGTVAVDQPSAPASTLTLTRPDGSTYAFDDVTVTCDAPPWDTSASGRIWAFSPRHLEGDHFTQPFLHFQGVVADLQGERTVTVPSPGPDDGNPGPLVLFVGDSPEEGRPANEAASSASGTGSVRVVRASCTPAPVLELAVDATLGSEMQRGQDLAIAGSLR